ncbi:uncharacterized protein [Pseudorasbora parva]|uniref:uncharacterized protein n=1 Tax=Pseudorasbora parva TaxID=51549 RepID=UPI00351EF069
MSMAHMMAEEGASGRSRSRRASFSQTAGQEVWRPGSDDRDQDPLPDPTHTPILELPSHLAALSSEFSVSAGPTDRRREWQSGSRRSQDDGHPSTPSKRFRRGIMSTSSLSLSEDIIVRRFCRETFSLSSRGSYIVDWRWSGDRSDSRNEQGSCSDCSLSRSDSLEEWTCPPLPGQVPVEPAETSHGLTEASPVKSSTGETQIKLGGVKGTGTIN